MPCKITVYTQAYNTEKYIEQCIKSVLEQDFKDFEYIIVDNGSTDKTKEIIEMYSKIDNRIILIRFEENRRGFWIDLLKENAKGEFCTTLDSDDFWERNYLSELYSLTVNNCLDIAIGGSKFYYIGTDNIGFRKSNKKLILEKGELPYYFNFLYQFFRPVWGKLFKTSLLTKNNVFNTKELVYGGDTAFCLEMLNNTNKIGITDQVLHNYRVHNNSSSFQYVPNRLFSDVFLFKKAEGFLESFGKISPENNYFLHVVYMNAIIDTINVILRSDINILKKLIGIKDILGHSITQQMLKTLLNHEKLQEFRKSILIVMSKIGTLNIDNEQVVELIYSNIILINENIRTYISKKDINEHILNNKFILSIINLGDEDIIEILKNNLLLSWIENRNFIKQFPEIVISIYQNNLSVALEKILQKLNNEDEIPFKEEMVYMCLNVSAMLEKAEIFVYAKKLQTQMFIEKRRFEDAKLALNDLMDMCPDDDDVLKLETLLEAENG